MELEWDPAKAAANFSKHQVRFAEAYDVLADPFALSVRDDRKDEERFVAIGANAAGAVRVVVYAWHGHRCRVISVRAATPRERRQYEEKP